MENTKFVVTIDVFSANVSYVLLILVISKRRIFNFLECVFVCFVCVCKFSTREIFIKNDLVLFYLLQTSAHRCLTSSRCKWLSLWFVLVGMSSMRCSPLLSFAAAARRSRLPSLTRSVCSHAIFERAPLNCTCSWTSFCSSHISSVAGTCAGFVHGARDSQT